MKDFLLDSFTKLNARKSFLIAQIDYATSQGEGAKVTTLLREFETNKEALSLVLDAALEQTSEARVEDAPEGLNLTHTR